MKRPFCKRCKGFLVKNSELVPGNGRIDFLLCFQCGWRWYRPDRATPEHVGRSKKQVAEELFQKFARGEL